MKYWKAQTKLNEKAITEENTRWTDIKDRIVELHMVNDNQIISLPPNMEEYVQSKTASAIIGSNKVEIETRNIGFKIGNNTILIKVNEKTNNISIRVNKNV